MTDRRRRRYPHMADEYENTPGEEYQWVAVELRRHLHPKLRRQSLVELNQNRNAKRGQAGK